jgi:transcription termination/antitermination protein NusA
MNPSELLRIVDAIHREKNIAKEIVFEGIEAALVSAAKKHYGEDQDVVLQINRDDGTITGSHNGVPLDAPEISCAAKGTPLWLPLIVPSSRLTFKTTSCSSP